MNVSHFASVLHLRTPSDPGLARWAYQRRVPSKPADGATIVFAAP